MISSRDISEKRFEKSKVFGYKTQDVDSFMIEISKNFDELHKEKKELEQKVDFLAEKLTEYRKQENKLTDILMEAKKVSDNVINKANEKAKVILSEAELKSNEMLASAQKEVERQQDLLKRLQKETSDFKNKLLLLYKSHVDLISTLPSYKQEEKIKQEKETQTQINQEVEDKESNKEKQSTMKSRTFSISLDNNGMPIKIDEEDLSDTKNIPLSQDVKKVSQKYNYIDNNANSRFKEPLKFGSNYNFDKKNKKNK